MAIDLPRGYRAEYPLRYFARDAESLSERVEGNSIAKAFVVDGKLKVIEIELAKNVARVSGPRKVIDRMLGLHHDPAPFERRIARDAALAPLIEGRRGLRIPMTPTVFEGIVWAIVGQQVNLAFAYKLRRVVTELAGTRIGSLIAHPDAAAVAKLDYDDLTRRQFSRRKAEYLIDTARLIASGSLDVEAMPDGNAEEVFARLVAIRGFGEWTANYVMMRACGFADCVPYGDSGLAAGLRRFFALEAKPTREETAELMAPFAPYRSLATFHFWNLA
ncbi:MAG TPA: DNA-3-methyladenine glycosylase 2 [Thermoanaerobaculia bacterium]